MVAALRCAGASGMTSALAGQEPRPLLHGEARSIGPRRQAASPPRFGRATKTASGFHQHTGNKCYYGSIYAYF